uniref:hypothetical protein n=1 Tax=Acidocella sp. C78 TaxID=1671486 RepID=UPI00191B9C17|nr:hypothetical protein [Acidocella sp. C78]
MITIASDALTPIREAIRPSSASAPSVSATESSRSRNSPNPTPSRQSDSSQKYSGGCTSPRRNVAAIAPNPAWPR